MSTKLFVCLASYLHLSRFQIILKMQFNVHHFTLEQLFKLFLLYFSGNIINNILK